MTPPSRKPSEVRKPAEARKPTEALPRRMGALAKLPVFFDLADKRVVLAGGSAGAACASGAGATRAARAAGAFVHFTAAGGDVSLYANRRNALGKAGRLRASIGTISGGQKAATRTVVASPARTDGQRPPRLGLPNTKRHGKPAASRLASAGLRNNHGGSSKASGTG